MPEIGQVDTVTIGATLPAGTNLLGKVGIDQTTPGTTNAVDIKTTGGATALDSTNKVPVSLYGKWGVAGDTAVLVNSTRGMLVCQSSASTACVDGVANLLNYPAGGASEKIFALAAEHLFNGTTWDRRRSNEAMTVLASAARTATVSSADFVNYNGKGLTLFINVSAAVDTPSVVFTIEGKDPISGFYWTLLSLAAVTGVLTRCAWIYPGITPVASQAAALNLPRTWRVTATHADADSITYSVAAVVNCN